MLFLWIILTIVGNVIEKADILTDIQVSQISTMSTVETVNTKDPDTGAASTYGNLNYGVIEAVVKAIWSDYAWLHNDDGTPNQYYWIWVLLYYPIMIGVLFMLVITILFRKQ
jgi:hypothetical protein